MVYAEVQPSFAGSWTPSAETLLYDHRDAPTLDLPERNSGEWRRQMVAVLEGGGARKQKAGRVLLAMGGIALLVQLWTLWLEAGPALNHGTADSLGWLGALGLAMLQAVDFIAWNPNGILLSVSRVLLLCWPVAVMMAGVALSRQTN